MASSWQPPIPSGALYSPAARQLGAGVALLAYCYDIVKTDGWFELTLSEASAAMDAPYPTMKYWWGLLKASGILAEVEDHGRKGIRARFDDYWLDWRILQARQPQPSAQPEMGSNREVNGITDYPELAETGEKREKNGTTHYPETEETADLGSNREVIGRKTGQPIIPNGRVYKVLHDDQESEEPRRADRAPPPTTEHQQLMAAYADWLGYKIPNGKQEGSAAKQLLADGYTLDQIERCYHELKARPFYAGQHLSLQTVRTNIGAVLTAAQESRNGSNGYRPVGPGAGGTGPHSAQRHAEFERYLAKATERYGDDDDDTS